MLLNYLALTKKVVGQLRVITAECTDVVPGEVTQLAEVANITIAGVCERDMLFLSCTGLT